MTRIRPLAFLGLGLIAIHATGCTRPRPRWNVLLISIDTLRADHLGAYGFPRPTSPTIDALAREGVLFKNARTPVPMTLPAHVSMLTGTLPPTHGLRDNMQNRLPDAATTLAEMLKARGFATGAVVSSFVLDRRFGTGQGFDSYDDHFQVEHKIGDLNERKGDEATRVATAWLESHKERPFFLFLHLYDPHDPYEPPEPFASRWKEHPYEGEVAFADHCAGLVLEKLRQLGLYDETLIVVTGDHGEMLGEHGELNHGFFIYEGALRVPLVMRVPRAQAGSRQVDVPVSLIDIVPTVVSLVGAPVPKEVQGVDLSPWLSGRGAGGGGRPLYAETVTPTRYYGASSLLGVVVDGWKYIETSRPELYDLRSDPAEAVNLLEGEPKRAEALGRTLVTILAAAGRAPGTAPESAGLDEAARQRLAALGYLGRGGDASSHGFDRSKEDAKDLIAFFRKDQRLNELVEEKKYPEARALCDDMLRERPGFADCHLQMSRIASAEGQPSAALTAARKAVAVGPGKRKGSSATGRPLEGEGRPRGGHRPLSPGPAAPAGLPRNPDGAGPRSRGQGAARRSGSPPRHCRHCPAGKCCGGDPARVRTGQAGQARAGGGNLSSRSRPRSRLGGDPRLPRLGPLRPGSVGRGDPPLRGGAPGTTARTRSSMTGSESPCARRDGRRRRSGTSARR